MELNENIISIVNVLITALIAVVTSIITSKYSTKVEKQITSRIIFDKCYSKIYTLTEYELFSKKITLEKVKHLGTEIIKICNSADNYFAPSIKVHAEWLRDSNEANFQENWDYFSSRFSMRYDIVCKDIGLPLRNKAYLINRRQYVDKWHYYRLFAQTQWPSLLFMILLLLILVLINLNS